MWQIKLKNDPLTNFFNKFRRVNQHLGENPIGSGETGQGGVMKCYFTKTPELKNVPSLDVETACRQYFLSILSLVYDCYIKFGRYIDAYQYYTEEHFKSIGKNIEDAEEELGFPRGWTDIGDPSAIPYRWQSLRDNVVGCEINHIFEQYLNKYISYPERLPNL